MIDRKEYERLLEHHKTKGFTEVDQAIMMCEMRYLIEYIEKVKPVVDAAKDDALTWNESYCNKEECEKRTLAFNRLYDALKDLEKE